MVFKMVSSDELLNGPRDRAGGDTGGDEQYVQQLEAELDAMRRVVTELRRREVRDQQATGEHPRNGRASPSTLFAQELERMESGGYVATRSHLDSPVKSNAIGGKVPRVGAGQKLRRRHSNIATTQSALLLHSARVKRELINLKAGLASVRAGGIALGSTLGTTQMASALGVFADEPEPEPEPEQEPEPEPEPDPDPDPDPDPEESQGPQLNPDPETAPQALAPALTQALAPAPALTQAQAQPQLDPEPQSQVQPQVQGQPQPQPQLQGAVKDNAVASEPQVRLPQIRVTRMTRPAGLHEGSSNASLARGTASHMERSRGRAVISGLANRRTRSPYVRLLKASEESSAAPSLPSVHRSRNRDWDRDRNVLNRNQNGKKRLKVRRNRHREDTSPVFERDASPTPISSKWVNDETNDPTIEKATAVPVRVKQGARDLNCFLVPAGKQKHRRRRLQRESMVV